MLPDLDHSGLIAFVRPLVGDDAEDVVQATYVKILETTAPHEGRSSKQTWACTIARRIAIDWLRERGRRPQTLPFTDGEGSLADGSSAKASFTVAPEDVARRLDGEAIFGQLSGVEQQLLLVSRLPEREIAAHMGWTRDKVAKGLKALRQKVSALDV